MRALGLSQECGSYDKRGAVGRGSILADCQNISPTPILRPLLRIGMADQGRSSKQNTLPALPKSRKSGETGPF